MFIYENTNNTNFLDYTKKCFLLIIISLLSNNSAITSVCQLVGLFVIVTSIVKVQYLILNRNKKYCFLNELRRIFAYTLINVNNILPLDKQRYTRNRII